jgi:diacylglycerol kinase (ATP)
MRAVLFHNPTAGPKALRKKDAILAALKLADLEVAYISTKSDDFKSGLKKSADFFIVAGGDGTVRKVLTQMPKRKIPVAILPFGTANNVARSLGIGGTAHELVESWQPQNTRRFDIGGVKGLKDDLSFVEAFGIGVIPGLLQFAAKQKKPEGAENLSRGRELLRKVLKGTKVTDVALKIDGVSYSSEILGLEVLNIAYTGPGLPLAPGANPGDGLFEVICIEPGQREAFGEWLESPQKRPAPVTSRIGSQIEISWKNAPARTDDVAIDESDDKQTVKIVAEKKHASVVLPQTQLKVAVTPVRAEAA